MVDEINLAPSECIDAIVHVMDDATSRHPKFRLFACMNPATDTGKRNLPEGVRLDTFVHEYLNLLLGRKTDTIWHRPENWYSMTLQDKIHRNICEGDNGYESVEYYWTYLSTCFGGSSIELCTGIIQGIT